MAEKWQWPDIPGHVENRSGWCSSRINRGGRHRRKALGLPFHANNRRRAERLHRLHFEDLIARERGFALASGPRQVMLYHAIREFFGANRRVMTQSVVSHFQRSFAYYCAADMPMEFERVYHHILDCDMRPPRGRERLASTTRAKYLSSLKRFFTWCIERRYLDANPIDVIGVPTRGAAGEPERFTLEELRLFDAYYRDRAQTAESERHRQGAELHRIFLQILFLTGMRNGELIRAQWPDVTEGSIKIWGKAKPNRANPEDRAGDYRSPRAKRDRHAAIRHFPLIFYESAESPHSVWQREIRDALMEARRFSALSRDHTGNWIFPFRNTQTTNKSLHIAAEAVGVRMGRRAIKETRKTARWYWENHLGMDGRLIADLLGHDESTSYRYYRIDRTVSELADAITRLSGRDLARNNGEF